MKTPVLVLLLCSLSPIAMAQSTTDPATIVQLQLDAYNHRDIEAFMALFSEDCRILEFPGEKVLAEGFEATQALYQGLFESSPNLHSELVTRTVLGTKVIDHERITGRAGTDVVELAVIFEVIDGKITSAMVVR
ncbi:MAG TPA: steroid delta-isomerase [Cytophagales bacterium]|nr:steroid delta-isomerase [Cytophagales bacterium]HAA19429.1 steroid delta-isomerase [Cytophagales bacterium]HAP63356.1 steroid delta-isomerase [Cytophagales bacterium]